MKLEKELSPHAQAALEQIDKCTSCGLCKEVCPVFALSLREAESPRGKLNLLNSLLNGGLNSTAVGVDIFNRCLLCYACQDACPAGVQTERVWIAAREILADQVGRPLAKSFFLKRILPSPRLWNLVFNIGRRLPGRGESIKLNKRVLPKPAGNRIDDLLPEELLPEGEPVGTVAYFPGCMLTEVFPHVGVKAAEILQRLGYRVITPRERSCCGAPAFNNGDLATGRRLALRNIELFSRMDVDAVISPDATCGGAFHHEYDLLFPTGSSMRSAYLELREKVKDFGDFILDRLDSGSDVKFRNVERRITIHDSCHLNHLQKKADVPRRLLSKIPGIEIAESPLSDVCCGFGGSYSIYFPGESQAISKRNLENFQAEDGGIICVGSPGCLWRLRSEAAVMALNVQIVHYLEVIWESLLGAEKEFDLVTQNNADISDKSHSTEDLFNNTNTQ